MEEEKIIIYIDNLSSEMKSDISYSIQPHNGKGIDQIIVSQDMTYAVTYSKNDNSILGWLVNIEENGQQQPDVYFELDQPYDILSFVLHKKVLLFRYKHDYTHPVHIIDLSDSEGRFLQLKHVERHSTKENLNSTGFLPNGDLILVSFYHGLKDCKIYKYSFIDKPTTNTTPWEYSQIYDIEIPNTYEKPVNCFVYQTKLFIFNKYVVFQWNLLTMNIDMRYILGADTINVRNIIINKNQTLLALNIHKKIDVFLMETGMWISRFDFDYIPIEFVTLKDGSEGLIVRKYDHHDYNYKDHNISLFIDPFLPSNDATDITNVGNIITKSNKRFSIIEKNVWITDGLNEDTFQKMLNRTIYHSNIYTLPIFKTIQNMLKDIIKSDDFNFPDSKIELSGGKLFHFSVNKLTSFNFASVKGFKKPKNKKGVEYYHYIFSYEQLNNQDLALITKQGILIYTIVDDFLRLRYFWSNEKWNDVYEQFKCKMSIDIINDHYKPLIREILDVEFSDSLSSLPSPSFTTILEIVNDIHEDKKRKELLKELILNIIDDPVEFSKFGLKILKIAIDKKIDSIVQLMFDRITKAKPATEIVDSVNAAILLHFITIVSLNLPKLCDNYYSSLVMRYITRTSIILNLHCLSIRHSTNTSLYAHAEGISIKKSNLPSKSLFPSFYKNIINRLNHLKTYEKTPTLNFLVPFFQICKYHQNDNDYNSWNEMLYKSKSILFCNIDTNNFYKWWNFAAIIDFKWKTFGRTYYYLIWFFYTIFASCFMLTSLDIVRKYHNTLFTISMLLGFMHLYFEIRQCLWKPKRYFSDAWNLFDVGAYILPVITCIYRFIDEESLWLAAMSNLLLNLKFLLFFRMHQSFGIYFAIIIGVAKKVFPFLVVLFFIIFGFAQAFYITLKSPKDYSLDHPAFDDNENNPWNLATKYYSVNSDRTISSTPTLIQSPDSNTNMFAWFPTSLLAMYLILIGDSGSLSSWTYREAHLMTLLLALITFSTVIYLMNLFIGLLNIAIEDYNKYEEFLLQKAQIIMEIELFYMLPYQRYKNEWFPDYIYYDIPVNDVRKLINAIDNNKTEFDFPLIISKRLRELVEVPETNDIKDELKRQANNELKPINDELKQLKQQNEQMKNELEQQMKDMRELLNNFIKNSNVS